MEEQSPDLITQESLRYRAETEHDNNANPPLQDCDHRSTTVQEKMISVLHTNPGRGRHHCHNRVGIYIMLVVGGGR